MRPAYRQSMGFVATLGNPLGFSPLKETRKKSPRHKADEESKTARTYQLLEFENPSAFPTDVRGLDAVDVFVLAGAYPLSAKQDRALQAWVRAGGHLVVCSRLNGVEASRRNSDPSPTGNALLGRWLPVTVTRQISLRDLSALEAFANRNSRIQVYRVRAARLDDPRTTSVNGGTVLAMGRQGPLIVRAPHGAGIVTVVGVDLRQKPISTWKDLDAIGAGILENTLPGGNDASGGGRLSTSGVTDLSTQLHRIQDEFPTVNRISAVETIGLLLIYILLIGPADYFLVHRVLKRPRLTWITFPILVGLATLLSVYSAAKRNGPSLQLNQFQIVDIDATVPAGAAATPNMRTRIWATLYSAESQRFTVDVRPRTISSRTDGKPNLAGLQWSGIPENVYGACTEPAGSKSGV